MCVAGRAEGRKGGRGAASGARKLLALPTMTRNPTIVGLQAAVVRAVSLRASHPTECTLNPKPPKIHPEPKHGDPPNAPRTRNPRRSTPNPKPTKP